MEDHPDAVVTNQAPSPRGTFEPRVLAVVRRIPAGRVATYGDVAALAGRPRAWRAVGTIMRTCRSPTVPCHRVVAAGGRLGGYSDPWRKRQLLQEEGIVVGRRSIRRFAEVRWAPKQ
jgi:O-6-methylguanine DNA methyltransferase